MLGLFMFCCFFFFPPGEFPLEYLVHLLLFAGYVYVGWFVPLQLYDEFSAFSKTSSFSEASAKESDIIDNKIRTR